ncbi:MAG: hypothetical protein JJV97_01730 [SAR324 cluster bacterium]|nr:hypothetical protein [SAR324 cluster bacterium]
MGLAPVKGYAQNEPVSPAPSNLSDLPAEDSAKTQSPENISPPAPSATQYQKIERDYYEGTNLYPLLRINYIIKLGENFFNYDKKIVHQYTGLSAFSGAMPSNTFKGIKLGIIKDFDWPVLKSIGVNGEITQLEESMDSMFNGKLGNTPNVKYLATAALLGVNFYFFNSFSKGYNPLKMFVGLGFGALHGKIKEDAANPSFESDIQGLYSHRELGIIVLDGDVGLNISYKAIQANHITANNDHFNQKNNNDEDLLLNFGGSIINISLVLRL